MANSKIPKDTVHSSDNLGGTAYTVEPGATRSLSFGAPTRTGYSLKGISVVTNQNYITTGVGVQGGYLHLSLHNGFSAAIDVKVTLYYTWERVGGVVSRLLNALQPLSFGKGVA